MTDATNHDPAGSAEEQPPAANADLLSALGGKQGLADGGLPSAIFITVYTVDGQSLAPALWSALGLAALLTVVRIARRQSLQYAFAGLLGVSLSAFLASRTGNASDFYLPGLFLQGGYALAYLVSILVRWPLIGVVVGPLLGEGMQWRDNPRRRRAFTLATWAWFAMFAVRLAVQLPLYLLDMPIALGYVKLAMGWPVFALVAWLTFVLVRSSPPEAARSDELAASD